MTKVQNSGGLLMLHHLLQMQSLIMGGLASE